MLEFGYILDLVESGDLCPSVLVIALLAFIGQSMVGSQQSLKTWGIRIASAAFLGYVGVSLAWQGLPDAHGLLAVILRGLVAGGLVLGVAWIVLAVLGFLARHLRHIYQTARHWAAERRRDRQRRSRDADQAKRSDQIDVERRRAAQQAEAKKRQAERQEAEAHRRRTDARLECQMLYDRHAAELAESFPRERLESYFAQYLSDDHPPELVEKRAEVLRELITECLEQAGEGPGQFTSLAEIAAHFRRQREDIAESDYDEETRQSLLGAINLQEDQAIRRFLAP